MPEQVLTEYELERMRFWAKVRTVILALMIILNVWICLQERSTIHGLQAQLMAERDLLDSAIKENRRLNNLLSSPDIMGCTAHDGILTCPSLAPRTFDNNGYPQEKQ